MMYSYFYKYINYLLYSDDGILDDVFEQLARVIVQISKTDIDGKQKENIYMILRTKLFSYLKDHKV